MYKGVFFDLDGTLLPVDLDELLNKYFDALAKKVQPYVAHEIFINTLLEATMEMMANDGSMTNEDRFMDAFFQRLDIEPGQLMPVLDEFYQKEYPQLGQDIQPASQARQAVEQAAQQAQVVLATNPLFPRAAVEARLEWAGLADFPFRLITTYENSSYCKPNPHYYAEMLAKIGLRGEDCLMVGNDTKEDLVAAELGFDTFLLEDYIIDRETPHRPTWRGSWPELLGVLGYNE